MTTNTPSTEHLPPDKTTLYCPNCGHASRIDGDWLVDVRANQVDYECPDCGTTVSSRPDSAAVATQPGGAMECCNAD
ncbi:hypothetical protein [Halovenus marina]|uniref:hypothetical protein n=1 Tax=Halovenus marina TaxID=3396621 RepID=UPI003F56CE06